jgi:hypothetical protein
MRNTLVFLAVVLMVAPGCNKKTTEVIGEGGKKLELTVPRSVSVAQGETAKLTVNIKRTEFDGPVDLEVLQLPKGVTVAETALKIGKGVNEATLTLKADAKAPPEAGQVAQLAAAGGGMKAGPMDIRINVHEKRTDVHENKNQK